MADHRFKLGQLVGVSRPFPDRTAVGEFEILRLLPVSVDGEPRYRVRGADKTERAVGESQLIEVMTA